MAFPFWTRVILARDTVDVLRYDGQEKISAFVGDAWPKTQPTSSLLSPFLPARLKKEPQKK